MHQTPSASNHLPRRRSTRLRDYDYSQAGLYFVTICTQNRRCLLGTVVDGAMQLNSVSTTIQKEWERLPERFPGLELDEWVIMPSHLHGILVLPSDAATPPILEIVRTFKAASTTLIRKGGMPSFAWQRGFYDRVIRNERELEAIREYIVQNPLRWALDKDNLSPYGHLPPPLPGMQSNSNT